MKKNSFLLLFAGLSLLQSCQQQANEVVVYCTVDQVFSEPVLKDFERETGIRAKAVYDTEETKSTGVMNRLIAEKDNPRCDVFWSGDPLRNNALKAKGITTTFTSPSAEQIPPHFREAENHWIGFSARARVLIFNKKLIAKEALPASLADLAQPVFKGKFALANPLFGTTTFHIAALFGAYGNEKAKQWLDDLKANGAVIATSNGDVKKRVMNGEIAFGLTDTDDAFEAMKESDDVGFAFTDQQPGGLGNLIMPNALSVIARSPNPENGKRLMDYLLSKETEAKLSKSCAQMPLFKGTETSPGVPSLDDILPMKVGYDQASKTLEQIQPWLKTWLER